MVTMKVKYHLPLLTKKHNQLRKYSYVKGKKSKYSLKKVIQNLLKKIRLLTKH